MTDRKRTEGPAPKDRLRQKLVSGAACLLIGLSPQTTWAIEPAPPQPAVAPAAEAPQAQPQLFTQVELEKLLAPVALYPDALLAQLLPAAAYPLEIVQAARWLEKNRAAAQKQDFSGADAQNWDPSVKAMLRFPTVLEKMNADLVWTTSLGDAIINQPQDVANVVQILRARAQQAGTLKSGKEMQVVNRKENGRDVVVIDSPDPSVVHVPQYDPAAVYAPPAYNGTGAAVAAGLLTFGTAVALGTAWRGSYWNWGTGAFYPPVWPGYPAWRPPYPGWRPGAPIGGGNINIGNDVNIGNGSGNNNIGNGNRPAWRPDPGHRPGGRPGGVGGIGSGKPGKPGLPGGGLGDGKLPGGGIGGGGLGNGGLGGGGKPNLPGGGIGGGAGRPNLPGGGINGGGLTGGNRPVAKPARPVAKPATRPATRPAARPGGFKPGSAPIKFPGASGRPGGLGNVSRPAGGGFNPGPVARPGGGGFNRGGMARPAGGGMARGGGMGRGGGGYRRSDIRLKHDIVLLGRLDNGLGLYRFVYNGGKTAYVGVMAQEVAKFMPEAVWRAPDGYLRVAYGKVGAPFQSYASWVAGGAHIPTDR